MPNTDRAGEIVRALRDMLPEKVDYAKLVCAEGWAHGSHYVWTEPEPYVINDAANLIESMQAELEASQRRERAHEAAIKRHYADMTSQCFICYSCVNHDAREKAQWDGKKLENYACSGCGSGNPKWQFDVGRFSQEVAK